jgi:hypothetical protein
MKSKSLLSFAMFVFLGSAPMAAPPVVSTAPKSAASVNKLTGDYVEARTASVFAGACHYNAELVTTGHDAVLAWNITAGSWKGADLSGIRAMAAVTSDANLGNETADRKFELVIDSSASAAQTLAFEDFVKTESGHQLGTMISVRKGQVHFDRNGRAYEVSAPGFASLSVQPMPSDDCCTQPNLVWYKPLVQLEHRKVGFTVNAAYTAATLGDPWQQGGDNSAFYGSFRCESK